MSHESAPLIFPVSVRKPFQPGQLPWLCRLYQIPYRKTSSPLRQFTFALPVLALFKAAQTLRLPVSGVFQYLRDGRSLPVRFNALNTQFHAVYLPQYDAGYEPELGAFMDTWLQPDDVFVDVGSNWGYFSLWVASLPGFKGRIHAFEPNPPTYRDLASVVEQAGLHDVVTLHDCALSDRDGAAKMAMPDHVQSGLATVSDSGGIDIRLKTLDGLGLPRIDFMKVDAEGHEMSVFKGSVETLKRQRPVLIFEHGRDSGNVASVMEPLRLLSSLDYRFFQPCWAVGETLVHERPRGSQASGAKLALFPVAAAHRMLQDSSNLVACPVEKLARLKALAV